MASYVDFDHVRVGSGWPAILDIEPIEGHEALGIQATFYTPTAGRARGLQRAELRRLGDQVRLFLWQFPDSANMPEEWEKGSELLWELER